ncbi:MAG TPA: BadF/BadG/BcrA/BcrD ATPase family protein, partial [Candidatus Baltobacteraceae bacterium]|nr:BadF/BadG/BcrA/BcrD ATPase family protein [Candidatus Baltobacteraceae bacterium]
MSLFAGIDGGQSSTVAVIGDESGRELARGAAGPADEVAQGADSTRLHDALHGALADALARAGLPANSRFASIVAGVSGYDGKIYGKAPELQAENITIVHDTVIAHAGALGGEPGIVVIAGTGSVAYARSERGETALVGGWGYLFGDEGSAFWLARDAVSDAAREADAGEEPELAPLILAHFSQPSLRALVRAFYAGEISRTQLARFAPVLLEQAERGNERAQQHVRDGAAALVLLARHAAQRAGIEAPAVAFVGGLMRSASLNDGVDRWLHELLPS